MLRFALAVLGCLLGGCATIHVGAPDGMKAYELSLGTSGARAAIAWHGGESGPDAIYLDWLEPGGAPIRISDGSAFAYEPDLQFIAGDPLLAWYEKDAATGRLTAWLERTDKAGRSIWKRRLDAGGGLARNPVVRVFGVQAWIAWIETPVSGPIAVWAEAFGADGAPIGSARRIGLAGATTWNLNATVDNAGRFYVTYDAAQRSRANELHLSVVDAASEREVTLSEDDGFASVYPDIAISRSGQAAVTWFDMRDGNEEVYLAVTPLADMLDGKPLNAVRLTHTPADSIGAYLAWNGDRLAVAWCDAQEGQQELYAQLFDRNGKPESSIRRLTHTPTQSSIPSIRPWRGGFMIAWNEYASSGHGGHDAITASRPMVTTLN